jgi:hypothetical protein
LAIVVPSQCTNGSRTGCEIAEYFSNLLLPFYDRVVGAGREGTAMTATVFGLLLVLFCPIALSIAVWVIALNGSAKRDEISDVVSALIGPSKISKRKVER